MKTINYRMIVSDFDGTLTNDDHIIPDFVKSAINEYVACGGIFAVCTGRMLRFILPRVREIGLKGLVVANQGSVIADIESGEELKRSGMPSEDTASICAVIEKLGYKSNIYCGDEIYCNIPKNNVYLQTYERIIGVETTFIGNDLSAYILDNKLFCQKVSCIVPTTERNEIYQKLNKKLSDKFDVTCSANVLIEISPKNETKGEALKFLCEKFKVPIERCIACGDNLNDISMVSIAGLGIAVANADKSLKEVADFVSASNNEGAVAKIIEKFGFI